MSIHQHNWSGHLPFHAAHFHQPTTLTEVQEIVRGAEKVSVIGGRHCFNDIADTTGALLSLAKLDKTITIDSVRQTATVNAGITYNELCPQLHEAGYALHNMASLDHITVIGACMTATHGSGDAHGNLATAVSGLEMVTASGDIVTLTRAKDGDQFLGAVVSLGALGVVTKVTLDLLPAFSVQQDVYKKVPLSLVYENFDAIMSAGYSVSLFPDWQYDYVNTVWVKQRLPNNEPSAISTEFFGAPLAAQDESIAKLSTDHLPDRTLTERGTPGLWYQRLPHFRLFDADQMGDELQSEYFVAREDAAAAMQAVARFREQVGPILSVSEIRTIAADKLWLSPAYEENIVGIHFNWFKDWPGVKAFLPVVEAALAPFKPRPHWGKLFLMTPEQVQAGYPRMADFRELAREYDPEGKFRNAYLDRYIFGV